MGCCNKKKKAEIKVGVGGDLKKIENEESKQEGEMLKNKEQQPIVEDGGDNGRGEGKLEKLGSKKKFEFREGFIIPEESARLEESPLKRSIYPAKRESISQVELQTRTYSKIDYPIKIEVSEQENAVILEVHGKGGTKQATEENNNKDYKYSTQLESATATMGKNDLAFNINIGDTDSNYLKEHSNNFNFTREQGQGEDSEWAQKNRNSVININEKGRNSVKQDIEVKPVADINVKTRTEDTNANTNIRIDSQENQSKQQNTNDRKISVNARFQEKLNKLSKPKEQKAENIENKVDDQLITKEDGLKSNNEITVKKSVLDDEKLQARLLKAKKNISKSNYEKNASQLSKEKEEEAKRGSSILQKAKMLENHMNGEGMYHQQSELKVEIKVENNQNLNNDELTEYDKYLEVVGSKTVEPVKKKKAKIKSFDEE